jgi:hypothetical protein
VLICTSVPNISLYISLILWGRVTYNSTCGIYLAVSLRLRGVMAGYGHVRVVPLSNPTRGEFWQGGIGRARVWGDRGQWRSVDRHVRVRERKRGILQSMEASEEGEGAV